MASGGRTPHRPWKEDTLDYMFSELVKSEKYKYLRTATPRESQSKTVDDQKVDQPPPIPDQDDKARNVFTSTPDVKPPSLETFMGGFERPPSAVGNVKSKLPFSGPRFSDTPAPVPLRTEAAKQTAHSVSLGFAEPSLIDLAKVPIPKLPQFSGIDGKGEASFDVWRFEVMCLQKEKIYPDAHILQAIRRSLKGEARDILLTVGDAASSAEILEKLNGIYGTVSSNESIVQQFYLEQQKENENVAQYSIRLENMLQKTKDYIPEDTKNEMLRSKLWNGLRDSQLKNASRFKYEMEKDFNRLRIEIRKIEQDMPSDLTRSVTVQQHNAAKSTDSHFEEILKRLKQMEGRIDGIEKNIERKIESKMLQKAEDNKTGPGTPERGRPGGYYRGRGYFRGQQRGGRRGNRGSLNENGSTS